MKKWYIILFILVSFFYISGCESKPTEKPVPTGSVENFNEDSKEIVKIYLSKSDSLVPLTDAEKEKIKEYHNKYLNNPRLTEEQKSLQNRVAILETSYFLYNTKKDRTKSKDIEDANEAIKMFFTYIKYFDKDGNLIK
ncbi:hypothetical protein FE783_12590 [Paenibacillus mesophilus]|uniref:hypothetical protein n=1 Tax=Paenibacillus mesophilus TaxID=2582849 RepID=UPI00110DC7C5|nr:hypothetical protein [Paenibacillus mesophilus]TMV49347.1 hypothetical protein FE783_12590 [Paenibacillus mesophilus]